MLKILSAIVIILTIWQLSPVRNERDPGPAQHAAEALKAVPEAIRDRSAAIGADAIVQHLPILAPPERPSALPPRR